MPKTYLRPVILWVISLAMIMLAACGAVVSTPTLPTATSTTEASPPSPDVPDIVIITRDLNAPTWTPYPTFTPYPSLTPCPTGDPCAILDDDQLRATQIVVGATGTQQAIQTVTSQAATGTFSPDQARGTQIIAGATATEVSRRTATSQATITATIDPFLPTATPTFSPTPTLTPTNAFLDAELETLRAQWLNELETSVGFSHRALTASVDRLVQSITNRDIDRARNFHLQPSVLRTEFDGSTYVAVITTSNFIWHGFSQLLLFRVTDDVPTLLPEMIREGWIMSFQSSEYISNGFQGEFVDYNQNGFPEAIIYTSDVANCFTGNLKIFEITPDGEFVDITPPVSTAASFDWVDINGDGMFELRAANLAFVPLRSLGCNPLLADRYFGWNGSAYEDISPTLDESFYPAIDEFWSSIDDETTCVLPSVEMYQMLVSYQVQGRLEEGWLRLQRVLEWRLCGIEVRADEFTQDNMLDLVIWVDWLLSESTPTP